jgi:hypothetical protein
LSKEDQTKLEGYYKLPLEEIKEKVIVGLNLIGNETIGKAFSSSSEDEQFKRNETKFNLDKINGGKINLGELNINDFALYLKREKLTESSNLLSIKDGLSYLVGKFNNFPNEEGLYLFENDKNKNVKVSFENSNHIHLDKFFSYGLYNSKDELIAILPFDGKHKDQEVSWNTKCIDKIYLRELKDTSTEKFFEDLILKVDKQMEMVNKKFDIEDEKRPKINVLLSDEEKFRAKAFTYLNELGEKNGLIYLSKRRLEEDSVNNQLLIFRHEYLHNVDSVLGAGENFSQKNKDKILSIASNALNQVITSSSDKEEIKWGDKDTITYLFSESSFFDEGWEGHPTENIREFFVSSMNIFLDPEFEKNLKKKSKKDQKKILEVVNKIFELTKKA